MDRLMLIDDSLMNFLLLIFPYIIDVLYETDDISRIVLFKNWCCQKGVYLENYFSLNYLLFIPYLFVCIMKVDAYSYHIQND